MKIAIIGFGPRGLACLENLILELSKNSYDKKVAVLIFEPSNNFGTGMAWRIDQPDTNYINISDHALQNLKGREKIIWQDMVFPSFPSYAQWCLVTNKEQNFDGDKDIYPSRSQMGHYLNERAHSICNELIKNKLLTIHKDKILEVSYGKKQLKIQTASKNYTVNECVLSMGHTPTEDSDETKDFKKHAAQNNLVYIHNPYEEIIARDDLAEKNVAIKGFGLSMLDITRQLTNYNFGNFKEKEDSDELEFVAAEGCVLKIIPYSFDGLPCVPKPYGRKVDSTFTPTIQQSNTFELSIRNHLANPKEIKNINFIIEAFAEVAAEVFVKNNGDEYPVSEIKKLAEKWLKNMDTTHDLILDTGLDTVAYMKRTVDMARGEIASSLDFTIGQVWRHLQPIKYRLFAFSGLEGDLMQELVTLDEQTKRYSYGPPVKSILQLIALNEAGILDLRFVNDPSIKLVDAGWEFKKDKTIITAKMLCNSVMDAPVLKKLDCPVFKKLQAENLIQPVHEELGVLTNEDATVIPLKEKDHKIPIAVIGRNAKGSVLGTDAILECFSSQTHDWAKGVVNRLQKGVKN